MDNRRLAEELARAESEKEVIQILKKYGYWDNSQYWRAFGDNENNWSTIGNQQSEAEPALVEKIVNSIDAILMKECLKRDIKPDSQEAPKSVAEALETYFSIKGGKIQDITQSSRTELAKSIILAASGNKPSRGGSASYPNLTLVDCGEGQRPSRMPETILSINKSNKLKVPFVQGKFNMGGTGVLRFCGEHNIQLIISKRCPHIKESYPDSEMWGVTVVRRERPVNGRRSSVFTYLVDEKQQILNFSADVLKIIPSSECSFKEMEYGMYCKMYEYKLPARLCTNINMGLFYRLSTLLPNLAYPVLLDECREYKGHSLSRALSGMNVRISDQLGEENNNIDEMISANFTVEQQKISMSVYVFKSGVDMSQFRSNEGIILTQNGQTHGSFDKRFYKRTTVGLSYLADSILTVVDCSNINETTREDLFMNSRDRMSGSRFSDKLERQLEEFFKENEQLRKIQALRREEAIAGKLDDEKPLEEVLSSVFKSSPVLSKLFVTGEKLKVPFGAGENNTNEKYEGKVNPTFFVIAKKKRDLEYIKHVELGRKFRVKLNTDALNDFFSRTDYPGEYILRCDGDEVYNSSLHLHNGVATLNVELPVDAQIGMQYKYELIITDTMVDRRFMNDFVVLVDEYVEHAGGKSGKRNVTGSNPGKETIGPSGIGMPNVFEVHKDEWERYDFDRESAIKVIAVDSEANTYDFFVNMDNIHLQTELKALIKNSDKIKLIKARYKYGMVLIGLSVLGYYSTNKEEVDVEDIVARYTKIVSPVLLPMIDVMGNDMDELFE